MAAQISITADNSPAVQFLEPYFQSGNINFLIGSGASTPAIKIAGNVEKEINDLIAVGKEAEADRKSLEFISAINFANTNLLTAFPTAPVRNVKSAYKEFLLSIDRILFARKNILLARQANIFTTNYDMFAEHAAASIAGIVLNDGFDRSTPMKPPIFAPERYFDRTYRSGTFYSHQIEIPTINLIKLHGSVSWRKRFNTVEFDAKPPPTLPTADQADPAKVQAHLAKHFLILPNLRKFHTTLVERVYYDLLRLYSRALEQQNVALFSFGFSFSDEHILDLTRRSLRNPTSHLIIFAYDPTAASDHQSKFAEQRNVTIVSPESGTFIDFKRLNLILSAILPAITDATT